MSACQGSGMEGEGAGKMGKVVTTGLQVGTSAQLLSPVQFFATP